MISAIQEKIELYEWPIGNGERFDGRANGNQAQRFGPKCSRAFVGALKIGLLEKSDERLLTPVKRRTGDVLPIDAQEKLPFLGAPRQQIRNDDATDCTKIEKRHYQRSVLVDPAIGLVRLLVANGIAVI